MNRELLETALGIKSEGLTKARLLRRKERILSAWSSKQAEYDLLSHIHEPTAEENGGGIVDSIKEGTTNRAKHDLDGSFEHSTMPEGTAAGTALSTTSATPVATRTPTATPNKPDGESEVERELELLQQQQSGLETMLAVHGITPEVWENAEKATQDEHAQRVRDSIVLIKMKKVRKNKGLGTMEFPMPRYPPLRGGDFRKVFPNVEQFENIQVLAVVFYEKLPVCSASLNNNIVRLLLQIAENVEDKTDHICL